MINLAVITENNVDVAFKNCGPFSTCKIEINDVFIDKANHVYIEIPMYKLIEYSYNCLDRSGTLWQLE